MYIGARAFYQNNNKVNYVKLYIVNRAKEEDIVSSTINAILNLANSRRNDS